MYNIYYFSGTGNTFASAKQIVKALEDAKVIPMSFELRKLKNKKDRILIEAENVIIMFPTYGYSLPSMVRRFLKKADIKCGYLALIATYASKYGAVLLTAKKLLKRHKVKADYFSGIRCVENYIPLFGVPSEEKVERKTAVQHAETENEIAAIKEKTVNKIRGFKPVGVFINSLFRMGRHIFVRFYRVEKTCTGCGTCERVCPSGCVKVKDGRARFGRGCEHCLACFNYCPVKALRFRSYKPSNGRYRHPDIRAGELNVDEED